MCTSHSQNIFFFFLPLIADFVQRPMGLDDEGDDGDDLVKFVLLNNLCVCVCV